MKRRISRSLVIIIVLIVVLFVGYSVPQPSNDRKWTEDQRLIPRIRIDGDRVEINNVRDFTYNSETDYRRSFVRKEFRLSDVQSVDFILSQFADWRGLAHAFLSFGYQTDKGMQYLAVSVEIRKEEGEEYSPFWGMLKQYELAYVIATETDVIQLRTHHRNEPLFLYPMQVKAEHAQELFRNILEQTHRLETEPEFYHTITNSCMSNIAKHVNAIQAGLVPFGWRTIFPGFADDIALEAGFISEDVTDIEEVRQQYLINERALSLEKGSDFSLGIRAKN